MLLGRTDGWDFPSTLTFSNMHLVYPHSNSGLGGCLDAVAAGAAMLGAPKGLFDLGYAFASCVDRDAIVWDDIKEILDPATETDLVAESWRYPFPPRLRSQTEPDKMDVLRWLVEQVRSIA